MDISHGQDILCEKFEEIAKDNQTFYQKYQKHKAKWLEEKTTKYLSRIFPSENIYRNLRYHNPDKTDGSMTELDAAVKWGTFLILVEAKAKQFRIESQLGDTARLRTDIKNNVEDAFEQGRRTARYISEASEPKFTEISTGRELKFDKAHIKRIYHLCVSQHYFSGLITQLSKLKELNLFKGNEYPLSICIADLDTISNFCDGPDIFLHYIERRLFIHKHKTIMLSHELDLFSTYLNCRLNPEKIFGRNHEEINGVWVAGGQEVFDAYMQFKSGYLEAPPIIKLNVPDEINEILVELRQRPDDAAKWIAFALLDISDYHLGAIAKALRELKRANLIPGKFRRLVHQSGDTVISFVASLDIPQHLLEQRIFEVTNIEKYRRKAMKSIGIGIMVLDKTRPFNCMAWAECPWEYDEILEQKMRDEPPIFPAPGYKFPGRNQACICGSGKKFKKCCLRKFESSHNSK